MNRRAACLFAALPAPVIPGGLPVWSAVLLDISPPGTSAGVGLSRLNEFLAGGFGMGGSGSGGETGAGISFDPATRSLRIEVAYGSAGGFSDLSGAAFAWYLHGPSPADRVGPVIANLEPLHQFATDPARGGFLDGSVLLTQPQAEALLAGATYLNFYTPDFQGGEIRGQLVVALVPEPVGWPFVLLPVGLLVWRMAAGKRGASAAGSWRRTVRN